MQLLVGASRRLRASLWRLPLTLCLATATLTPLTAADTPLPLMVVAGDLVTAPGNTQFLQPGQALELIGMPDVAVVQPEYRSRLQQLAPEHFQWVMPDAGADLTLTTAGRRLRVLTARPLGPRVTRLGNYEIGRYPPPGDRGLRYQAPAALVEVRPESLRAPVSQHFRIGQFLCKQKADWPRYVTVTDALLAKLERLVRLLQQRGLPVKTLTVMSGYRTPSYNRALGNVAHSRHIYGDAADVFVDLDGDDLMDDLNGDGAIDVLDAVWLLQLLEADQIRRPTLIPGGLAAYRATAYHGPFLHIDARGEKARWGHQPSAN